jgi:hypothetical protein
MLHAVSALTESTFAWEPITPRGVAAFARASFERLLVVQSILALVTTIVVVWLLANGFFPTVTAAVRQLPDTGQIDHGELIVPDATPQLLAEGHFLAFILDAKHTGQIRSPAQFQFEFGKNSLLIFSLFGEAEIDYPVNLVIFNQNYQSFYFNRTDLQPKWGAWAPEILGLAALAVFFGLLLSWTLLATLYFLPVWLIAFFANRDLNFRKSWRLAGAALMPGALLMTLSIWLYGIGAFDLIKLCFAFGMHFLIGWIYLFVSPLFVRRTLPPEKKNPFATSK